MNETGEALRTQFHLEMVNAFQTCIRGLNYHPTIAMHHFEEHGAVETAHWLVNLRNDPSGFTRLWEARRLDLSAEALVLKPEYASLFAVEGRRIAYDVLKEYGYVFPSGFQRP